MVANFPPRTVSVLYFAAIADLARASEERLALPDDVTNVGELCRHLERIRPTLRGRLESVRVAVNESFADPDASLSDGDVVALVPPVSGG